MTLLFVVVLLMILSLSVLLFPRRRKSKSARAVTFTRRHTPTEEDQVPSGSQPQEVGPHPTASETTPILPDFAYTPISDGALPTALVDLSEEERERSSRKIRNLPAMPTTSMELDKLLKDPNSSAKDVAALVSTNPVLSARLLRAINSAYFNLPEKTTSVGRAIVLMGYNNVRSIVMYECLRSVFSSGSSESRALRDKLWAHSTVVSASAHYISHEMLAASEHEMATIGLLHDIGKFFLGEPAGEKPGGGNRSAISQEVELFGTTHAALGGLIAENWDLSARIANCVAYHHHPAYVLPDQIPEAYRRSSAIVYLADLICRVLGYKDDGDELLPMRDEYYEILGMESDLSRVATRGLIREIERAHATVQSYISGR